MDTDGPMPDPSPWHPETDLQRLKVLGKLLEELGEGVSAAARCIIQGIDEVEPVTLKPNRLWIEDEMADILANVEKTISHFRLDRRRINHRRARKLGYISRWVKGLVRPAAATSRVPA